MKVWTSSLLVFFFFFFSGCLKQQLKPEEPIWGKQACATCRMILSEKRYAVQRVLPSGEIIYYDDMNCALKHSHNKNQAGDEGILYVRPYGGEVWIRADEAKYASGLMTPMNSGYGAQKVGGTINFSEIRKKFQNEKDE